MNEARIRWYGEFENAAIERDFYREEVGASFRTVRLTILIVGLLYMLFIFSDTHYPTTFLLYAIISRVSVTALSLGIFFASKRLKDKRFIVHLGFFFSFTVFVSYLYVFYLFGTNAVVTSSFSAMIMMMTLYMIPAKWRVVTLSSIAYLLAYLGYAFLIKMDPEPVFIMYSLVPIPIAITSFLTWRISISKRQLYWQNRLLEQAANELEQKVLQRTQDLEEKTQEAVEANRAKSAFLRNVSHEVRTPINAITGMTSVAQQTDDPARISACLNNITIAAMHLLGTINGIIDMAQFESGQLTFQEAAFSFRETLQKAVDTVLFSVHEKRIDFELDIDEALPNTLVSDSHRLTQVITNLLSNAVKFTAEGGSVSLRAKGKAQTDGNVLLSIQVQDNGIGIGEEQQAKLFTPFMQVESAYTRKFGGTGLGLVLCKRIAERMGGTITVQSAIGKGSSFTFTALVGLMPDEAQPNATAHNYAGKRVLLAEDAAINREILMALLEDSGMVFTCAENGRQAVDAYRETAGAFDLIFMDVQMPVLDGVEATRQIRAMDLPNAKRIPIIATTANVSREDIDAYIAAGMNAHLSKPLNVSDIFAVLARCF
ncbi:MAG: response regulator [Oscillospiraceae bacterium]|jgi:signal transduction histidine kinase/CheY-like chemotaxis protein|nr:response regulator [Oscillospiraceae bacterium]